jgi:maleate isomerase
MPHQRRAADGDPYGYRGRIGYVCPPALAEVFPYEFYRLVPPGVTLVITTLTVTAPSRAEVEHAYDMSLRAARELAAAGVDIVFLGGVPVNQARGHGNARDLLGSLALELGVKVSSSVAAQARAARTLGARRVVLAHPYGPDQDARLAQDAGRFGCEVLGVAGLGSAISQFGRLPVRAALDLGRDLLRRHPDADAIFFPSPHWPVIEAIAPLEGEFGVSVMSATQACVWDALRQVGVTVRIEHYGRLLREF